MLSGRPQYRWLAFTMIKTSAFLRLQQRKADLLPQGAKSEFFLLYRPAQTIPVSPVTDPDIG